MRRSLLGLCIVAAIGSPALAAPAHRSATMRAVAGGAGASSMFDHVPAAAERIAAGFGVVTSTFRTVEHNRAVGGVPNSFHLLGRAMDVARRPGVTHAQIAAALRSAGFALVESLDEGNHSHFAFSGGPVRGVVAPVPRQVPAPPAGPHIAADEHGALLADVVAQKAGAAGRSAP